MVTNKIAIALVGSAVTLALVSCGGGGGGGGRGASVTSANKSIPTPSLSALATFAGDVGGRGNVDATGPAASFLSPQGMAVDNTGNVYVSDGSTIRKITPGGAVTTLAGSTSEAGSTDGIGSAARFSIPEGMAVDSAQNVYVADSGNNTIRKITPAGVVTTFAGSAGVQGSANGTGAAASFTAPVGLAIDNLGNLYVADPGNETIRKITPAGVVSTLAGTPGVAGSNDGTGAAASFNRPVGIAADTSGNLYVIEVINETVRRIAPGAVVTTLAGSPGQYGSTDGTGSAARFYGPSGISTDSSGNLYVTDGGDGAIRKVTTAGVVTTVAGNPLRTGYADGTGSAAVFNAPSGIATNTAGISYIADSNNSAIRAMTPAGVVTTFAGSATVAGATDGVGTAARFALPSGLAVDAVGNVYVSDTFNLTIRKITPGGVVSTFAGSGTPGSADGVGTAASFGYRGPGLTADEIGPAGLATDNAGNVYVADPGNSTIRMISPSAEVTTFAGSAGVVGSADGVGGAARFWGPSGLATDGAGNLYVADSGNNTIRLISPAGAVSTLAGLARATGSADGPGAAARFNSPSAIATDAVGNIYVADGANETIRKITQKGVVSTLAGTPGVTGHADGTGAAASFDFIPTLQQQPSLATDGAGNVYVGDAGNNLIRKITPDGVVTTLVGVYGTTGFLAAPLPASISSPNGLAIGAAGLFVTTSNGVAVVH